MDAIVMAPITMAGVARWSGRILSLLSIGLISLFVIGEPPWPWRLTGFEALLLLCFPISVVVGLILAWWREGLGALVAILGVVAFDLVHLAGSGGWPRGPWFLIFASPAAFFLVSWALRRRDR
ncbi:DUF7670 domain-containing protein [Tautonia marina]|uniref:DUF7670 domain-containing protein n=1 Tax=Tautonia marina TaxID=2653855 RepID=UPI001260D907|nr:hypothetical protein [Tautonia marina]